MAGDWIKWVKGLTRKPEVFAIAAALGLGRREVASALMEVWEWADDCVTKLSRSERDAGAAADDGVVTVKADARAVVDALVGVPGFAAAMESVGWLRVIPDAIEFPKFSRHNGKNAKERALAAERQRAKRHAPVTPPSRSGRDETVTREEKSREENKNPPTPQRGAASGDQQPEPPPMTAGVNTASTPRELADLWAMFSRGPGQRLSLPQLIDGFAAMVAAGHAVEALRVEILRPDRDRSETWQTFRVRMAKGKERPGPRPEPARPATPPEELLREREEFRRRVEQRAAGPGGGRG